MTMKLEALLARRAAALAQPRSAMGEDAKEGLICFASGSLLLGVGQVGLRTVVHAPRIVCLGGLPAGIVGIASFKGELTSVLDFGLWTGLGPASNGRLLVVVEDGGRALGLRADKLVDASSFLGGPRQDQGCSCARPEHCISRVTQELVSVLDLPALFEKVAYSRSEGVPRE